MLTVSIQEAFPSATDFFFPREEMSFAAPSALLLLSPVAETLLKADIAGLGRSQPLSLSPLHRLRGMYLCFTDIKTKQNKTSLPLDIVM